MCSWSSWSCALALSLLSEGKLSCFQPLLDNLLFTFLALRWSTGLTLSQWFLCPAELKVIGNHQWMALSAASSAFALQTLSPFTKITLSTPQLISFSDILFNSSMLQLCQDFLHLSHKECFLSLFCSRGWVLMLLLPPKKSLCCLTYHSSSSSSRRMGNALDFCDLSPLCAPNIHCSL